MNTRQTISIGDYLLLRLKECGIDTLFGVPGDFNLTFLEQILHRDGVQWVGNCNELNAAYAADGYSRLRGAAALVVTYGVGDLSAINGIAGAFAEHVPLICISGMPPLHAIRKRLALHHTSGSGNMEDVMQSMAQFTVAQSLLTPANASAEIDRVITAAMREKMPVYLQLPSDIVHISIQAPAEALDWTSDILDAAQLDRAVKAIINRLDSAERPAILVDGDAHRFGLRKHICALGHAKQIPFSALVSGRSVFDEQHPLYRGLYAGTKSPAAKTIEGSDCLIAIGARFFDISTGIFTHSIDESKMIQIHAHSVEVGEQCFSGVTAEAVLIKLADHYNSMSTELQADINIPSVPSVAITQPTQDDPKAVITHATLWKRVESFLKAGDVVVAENGTSMSGISGIRMPANNMFIAQSLWASIGYTLPALLGSMMAAKDRRHILFIGDGSLQMTVQEISTISRQGLKPIIFVVNNYGYTIERIIHGPNSLYNDVQNWDYTAMSKVFMSQSEVYTSAVRTHGELTEALVQAEKRDCLCLIELQMDPMDMPDSLRAMGPLVAQFDYGM